MAARFNNGVVYQADQVGLNNVLLTSEQTSTTISCEGRDQLVIYVNLSTWAAASTVSVAVDTDEGTSTTWYPEQSDSVASGIATLSPLIFRKAVTAATAWHIYMPIIADKFRIRITSVDGTTDRVSVKLRLSNTGNS